MIIIILLIAPFVYPDSTGKESPEETGDPSNDWAKPDYIKASDNKYTTSSTIGDLLDTSKYLFYIPTGATIDGILVQVEMKSNGSFGEAAFLGVDLSWDGGTSYTTSKQQKAPTEVVEKYYNFGNSTDTWGRTWDYTDFGNDFRARINFSDQTGGGTFNPGVDHIQIEVYYTQHHTITLNSPENGSSSTDSYAFLNVTVEDPDVDMLEICIYGANDTSDFNEALLYHGISVANPVIVTYNFTSPVVQPDDNTILLFHMDNRTDFDETNTHIYDFSGNGNNGTATGAVPTTSGYFAGGFEFDGDSDRISIPDADSLDVENFTIAMWINPESTASSPVLAFKDSNLGSNGFIFRMDYSGGNRLVFSDGSGPYIYSNTNAFTPDTWNHVAVVVNLTTVTFYSNGEEWGIDVGDHRITNNSNTLYIGKDPAQIGRVGFNGTMDEIGMWNRTLPASEIKNLYRLQKDTYYWNVTVSDGTNESSNGTFEFTVDNAPPTITINDPENQSTTTNFYSLLNWSISDYNDDTMEVWVYGANDTGDMYEALLYHDTGLTDGTLTYNFTSPITQSDANTVLLIHMDNRSEFGENSTYMYDFSGNGNNGTAVDNAAPTTSGYFAGGFEFDGDGDYINLGNSDSIKFYNNIGSTYNLWVYPKTEHNPLYASCGTAAGPFQAGSGFSLYMEDSDGNITLKSCASGSTNVSDTTVPLDTWSMISILYQPPNEFLIYFNGIYQETVSIAVLNSTADTTIGLGEKDDSLIYANGTIDEVAIWNRSLSADEIKNLYQLSIDTYYWNVTVFDGTNTTSNATLEFSVVNAPPTIIVNSPANESNIPEYYALLNWTIGDINEDTMEVWVYGANDTGDMYEALLYHDTGLTDGTLTYNFTSPVTQPDSDTFLLMHLDNRSEFDENNTHVYDFSGKGNNGTAQGSATPNISGGYFAGGFEFDGNGDYIQIPDSGTTLDFDDAGNYTWSFWIKPQPITSNRYLFAKYAGGLSSDGYIITLLSTMNISMARYDPLMGGLTNEVVSTTTLSTGVWYHVAVVFNTESNISIYIDGDFDVNGSGTYTDDKSSVVRISNAGTNAFNGTMDEVVFWNRTLSADEIEDLYQLKVNNKYYWNVTASDGEDTSSNATWEFNISTVVSISLPVNSIAFGELNISQTNATDDDDPFPLILQNDGNVKVDVKISGSHIWNGTGAQNPSSYYQFRSEQNESGSVDSEFDLVTEWTPVPGSTSSTSFAQNIHYEDEADSIKGHINLTVPSDEPAGDKSSVLTFIAVQS